MTNDNPEIRYLGDVRRLRLAPDDILVLSVEAVISHETAERLRTQMETAIGGMNKVLVLCDGIKLGVLAKDAA